MATRVSCLRRHEYQAHCAISDRIIHQQDSKTMFTHNRVQLTRLEKTKHCRSSKAGHIMHLFNTLLVPQTNRSPTERTTNTPPTKIPCIRTKIFSLFVKIVGIYDGVSYNKAMQIKWAKPLWNSLSNTMCRFLCVFSRNCFVAWITTRVTLLSFAETEKIQ